MDLQLSGRSRPNRENGQLLWQSLWRRQSVYVRSGARSSKVAHHASDNRTYLESSVYAPMPDRSVWRLLHLSTRTRPFRQDRRLRHRTRNISDLRGASGSMVGDRMDGTRKEGK